MAFPIGWGRRCELVIQSSLVTDTETNFPVLVATVSLPSEMLDADGSYPALNGGGDIRFSSDEHGNTQLPCEIEQFVTDNDPANGKAFIWVNVPSLASASNTSIWVWYNKSGESQPAEDNAYGKEAVWDSDYIIVQHMNQDPSGTPPQMIDSTSNDNDGTSGGTMTLSDQVPGHIDGNLNFDGADDVIAGTVTGLPSHLCTVSSWIYPHTEGELNEGRISMLMPSSGWNAIFFDVTGTNRPRVGISDGTHNIKKIGTDNDITLNAWNHVAYSYDGVSGHTGVKIYVNSSEVAYSSGVGADAAVAAPANYCIGANTSGGVYAFDGLIEEHRVSKSVRSAGWNETEYNNQNTSATFLIEGTPEAGRIARSKIGGGLAGRGIINGGLTI